MLPEAWAEVLRCTAVGAGTNVCRNMLNLIVCNYTLLLLFILHVIVLELSSSGPFFYSECCFLVPSPESEASGVKFTGL